MRQFAGTIKERRVVLVGLVLVLAAWVLDVQLDAYLRGESFVAELAHPSAGEFFMRCLFLAIELSFVCYTAVIVRRYRGQGEQLEEAVAAAENERARADAVLEAVGDAISIQDPQYRIIYQNQAHKELLGDHVGEHCYEAYQQQVAICVGCNMARRIEEGIPHKRESMVRTPSGAAVLEIISTPLRDAAGNVIAGIEAVRDITDRKRGEMEIKRINGELEQRAAQLSEANRDLEAFSYSLSHDLRTYITRVSTAQQILEHGHALDAEAQYVVRTIADSCKGMEDLVDAMLLLSQVSHKELEIQELDLSTLALETVLQLQQQEPQRQVKVEVAPELRTLADPQLVKIVLQNLLGNAWKYTRSTDAAHIAFGATEREGMVFYFVKDNGVGFDMAEKHLLFRPFQRLKNARSFIGTGVGLATVQRVINRHGGEIVAEGAPGGGATFYFSLPG